MLKSLMIAAALANLTPLCAAAQSAVSVMSTNDRLNLR
jgi:hypothetical protein